jgi:putative N6-adenine-specific DNA methylase
MQLPRLIGLKASRRTPLYNGALECRLFEYRLIAGTMRRPKPLAAEHTKENTNDN